jgi:tetratricopeptide (TPR) repeat protein
MAKRATKERFHPVLKKAFIVLMLAVLCTGVVSYKNHLFKKLPFFDRQDGDGFFWTESAFHFRHFLMIAEGRDIPPIDRGIQYPEGLDTVRYITPVMERVAGTLYRLFFSSTPPHLFLPYFSFVLTTLSVLAVFLTGKIVWRSNLAAFIAAFFYGLTPASLIRTAGGGFIREDFALPLIFFSFACFMYCLRKDKPLVSALGSTFLFIALAAWHVTQLYLSLFMIGMTTAYFINRKKVLPQKSLVVFVAFMVGASILLPVLRAKYFVFSPALMLSYGLLAASLILALKGGDNRKNTIIGNIAIIALFASSLIIQKLIGAYSHVYELILAKIRFLGVLPEDPAALSFEAKSMWTSAFVSPKLIEIPMLLSFTFLFGAIGAVIMIYRISKRKAESYEMMTVFFTLCTFVLFLMIHRMHIFAVFFLALSMGALTLFRNNSLKYIMYGFLGVCLLVQFYLMLNFFSLKAFRPDQNHLKNMLTFIRENTDKDSAVLTSFQLGPSVAVYTGRPVILHSKFESKLIRDKVNDVYTSLFNSESEFYELCRRYEADLFVYQMNIALEGRPMSVRYLAGAKPLRTDSAAFLLHFAQDKLKLFRLIYQNPFYRVYKVGWQTAPEEVDLRYEPIYDLVNFLGEEEPSEFIPDAVLESGAASLRNSDTHRKIGDRFFLSGDYKIAGLQYERTLAINQQNTMALWGLSKTLLKVGEKEKAMQALRTVLLLDPNYEATTLDIQEVTMLLVMGAYELERKQYDRAERIFKKAIQVKPDSEEAYSGLGEAVLRIGKFKEAEAAFQKVISLNARNHNAYENLARVYTAQGDLEKATIAIKKSLAINPDQPHLYKIFDEFRKQMQKK